MVVGVSLGWRQGAAVVVVVEDESSDRENEIRELFAG